MSPCPTELLLRHERRLYEAAFSAESLSHLMLAAGNAMLTAPNSIRAMRPIIARLHADAPNEAARIALATLADVLAGFDEHMIVAERLQSDLEVIRGVPKAAEAIACLTRQLLTGQELVTRLDVDSVECPEFLQFLIGNGLVDGFPNERELPWQDLTYDLTVRGRVFAGELPRPEFVTI